MQFRAVRIKKGWRQLDLAIKAGMSRAAISRLERGRAAELTLGDILHVAGALDMTVRLSVGWQGGDLDRLVNARHAALHEAVAILFADLTGWQIAPEVSFAIYGERGVIDILAWHESTRTLLVIELKTEIVDINELMGKVDVKRRLASKIAAERGWQPARVAGWVIVAEGRTNRRRVSLHRTTLRAAFPLDGRSMTSWLRRPDTPASALSFWSNAPGSTTNQRFATIKRVRRRHGRE